MFNPYSPESFWNHPYLEQQAHVNDEEERGDFQTRILLDYFEQISGGERFEVYELGVFDVSELLTKLKERLLDGRLRINWVEEEDPSIGIVGDEERFVQALLPQWLFNLISKDSDLYYKLRASIFEKGKDRLANRLGILLGLEQPGMIAPRLHVISQQRAQGDVRNVIGEIVRQSVRLAE